MSYFAASARNRARARTMPDIDKAMGEMREHSRNTQDADTWKRGMLIREMENRTGNYGKDGFTGQMPPALPAPLDAGLYEIYDGSGCTTSWIRCTPT